MTRSSLLRRSLMLSLLALCACREAGSDTGKSAPAAAVDPMAAPPDLRAPPADAVLSPSGLRSKVLRAGRGVSHPRAFDRVSLQYTGWTAQGQVFASTLASGAPATFRVDEAMPGWSEGLQLMVEGEKRRLWIPERLAFEGKPDQPQGPLVIDVELLQIAAGTAALAPPAERDAPADAERTASGLRHVLLKPGTSEQRAAPYDRVRIVYAGWSHDGRMIESSQARGGTVEIPVNAGSPGWREALQLLRVGEKRRFWIPEQLASRSYPGAVPGTLVFEIELLGVTAMPKPPPPPSDVAHPPKDALHMPNGIAYRVLRKGTGTRKPDLTSSVEVHYSFWSSDGRLIDSTLPSGAPHRAELEDGDLPPGLTQAVQSMVVGEKVRLWMPEALGFSTKGRPHTGPLVFDLELIALYVDNVKVESVEAAER